MVFTATTNTSGKNGDKKQNTLPYPYNFKVVEVCLVGAGDGHRNILTSTGIKTHILTQKTPIFRRFCVIFYPFSNRLWGDNFEPTSAVSLSIQFSSSLKIFSTNASTLIG